MSEYELNFFYLNVWKIYENQSFVFLKSLVHHHIVYRFSMKKNAKFNKKL